MPSSIGFPARISSRAAIDLVPGVPEQEAARPPLVVDEGDDALAIRLVPPLDRREPRIDFAHCLVAEVEEVGVEEREVVVRLPCAGHVRADRPAVRVRVILVLDAGVLAERGDREVRDVTGREDVVAVSRAAVFVHDDPVVDGKPRGDGELRCRLDPEPGDDDVGLDHAPGAGGEPPAAHGCDRLARQHLHALLAVVVRHELRERLGEQARGDRRFREHHGHVRPGARQRRRDLRADEAAADHGEARARSGAGA